MLYFYWSNINKRYYNYFRKTSLIYNVLLNILKNIKKFN